MSLKEDEKFIKIAIEEAKKGGVFTHPNPCVGAVIVKNGKIISKGYHKEFGKEHAEINAIKKLTPSQLKGSTLYLTLEPCSTYGKTPPCTDVIIKSGIKKVVFATIDPNPNHRGKAVKILKENGIEVKFGVLEDECREINKPFFKNMEKKLPYITIKLATSIDSKIADKNYNSKWISSQTSRRYVHHLRAESDCIVVGINTILKDDPLLNIRYEKYRRLPDICVIDPELKIPFNAKIFSINDRRIFIVSNKKFINLKTISNLEILNLNFGKQLDLKLLLKVLYSKGIRHILVEGGGKTAGSFISQMLFDRIILFFSPLIIGSDGIEAFNAILKHKNDKLGLRVKLNEHKIMNNDIMAVYTR